MTLNEFIKAEPESLTARAYNFAKKAHASQKRKSGEPYFNHVAEVAKTLLDWKLDESSVAAGLLHDVVEDTLVTPEELRQAFGEEITFLVDGVTKLGRIKYRGTAGKVENLRKMIFALSEDLRVVFIKLADRLHNMKTLSALPPVKQKRIAMETEEIYAPIAYRLGMQSLAGELRDLAFPYLYPRESRELQSMAGAEYGAREKYLRNLKPQLEEHLAHHAISPQMIDFRAKRLSSLYQKLLRYNADLEKIYDLVAMRIIVETIEECYAALGVVHQLWPPLPGRIKDFIAMPKPNGYRSLHTTVIGPEEKFVEIQIRTRQMHEENEYGIAAHWIYEQVRTGKADPKTTRELTKEIEWVQQLRRWQEKFREVDSEEFLDSMKIDFFRDRIFAITPHGDVMDLPAGATPVDFAYQIHSDIGNSCVGAKVNDKFTPLDYELHSGDMVHILTQKGKKPSEDWLEFVKTATAHAHIKAALKDKDRRLQSRHAPRFTEFKIVAKDRVGLIKDVSGVFAKSHVNITGIHTGKSPSGNFPVVRIQCPVTDKKQIERLMLKLKRLKEVKEVGYQLT
ncbi:MAG: RelA/SpoT family protein [Patescibacteria group bacterium]